MRMFCVAILTAVILQAAVIRGVVVEHQTGKPLARALVVLQPVAGTQASTQSARTNSYGAFEFLGLSGGAYLVTASRRSFAPSQYGQKRWKGSGVPVVLEETASTVLDIRLQRFGSIAGTILDENEVGLPEHDVVVYRYSRPPQLASKGRTDDRGMYRIWGLEPGLYLVRSLGKQYEDGGYLPTFSKEAMRVEESRPVEVLLDQQTSDVNVRPVPGQLFTVAGKVNNNFSVPVTLTLISDTGTATTACERDGSFKFDPVAPGPYELAARSDDRSSGGTRAAWMPITVERDRTDYRVNLAALPELRVTVEDTKGQPVDLQTVSVLARRKDLSGDGTPEILRLIKGSAQMAPGRWDLALAPGANHYVAGFSGQNVEIFERGRADGWNPVVLQSPPAAQVKFVLSSTPGALHGTVLSGPTDTAAGAPVFLEAYDAESKKRLTDVRMTRTDLRGKYQFYGLAPGNYRVMSSFEFETPDSANLDAANPKTVKVEDGQDAPIDLDLFVIR